MVSRLVATGLRAAALCGYQPHAGAGAPSDELAASNTRSLLPALVALGVEARLTDPRRGALRVALVKGKRAFKYGEGAYGSGFLDTTGKTWSMIELLTHFEARARR